MKRIELNCMLLMLVLSASSYCMEREEGDKPANMSFEEQKELARKERAEKYRREKEQEEKEKKQEDIFAEAKEAIAIERQRLEEERHKIKQKKKKVPKSINKFINDNIDKLQEGSADEALVTQVVEWINNNEVNVGEPFLIDFLSIDSDIRILYALLHNPLTRIPSEALTSYFTARLEQVTGRMRDQFSIYVLFYPFGLQHVLEHWVSSPNLQLVLNLADELKLLKKSTNPARYLASTKNLDLIRAILFLVRYPHDFTIDELRTFKIQTAHITGNERAPDGTSGFMFAVGGGYLELVRELLQHGANPFQTNRYGDDAISILEMQRYRLAGSKEIAIYDDIRQLLEGWVKQQAKNLARAIFILMMSRVVKDSDGKRKIIPGLPYELALHIVISALDEPHQRQVLLHYLEQIPEEELTALRAEIHQQVTIARPLTLLEWFSSYLPAGVVTALSLYFARGSNP